jgi:hypothetical protein
MENETSAHFFLAYKAYKAKQQQFFLALKK